MSKLGWQVYIWTSVCPYSRLILLITSYKMTCHTAVEQSGQDSNPSLSDRKAVNFQQHHVAKE